MFLDDTDVDTTKELKQKVVYFPWRMTRGAVVGMFATKEEKMAFERKHSQVSAISNSKGV